MNGPVAALALWRTNLYAAGAFTTADGLPAASIAQWNGNSWSGVGSGIGGFVLALAASGNKLFAAGSFTNAGGIAATNIAQWDGTNWSALGSGVGGQVMALATSGSSLYAGGYLTTAGGRPANYIARWDGSSWSALGSGMNSQVAALAMSGSMLYAAGSFTMAGTNVSHFTAEAIVNPGDWLTIQAGVPGPQTNTLTYIGLPGSTNLLQYTTNLQTGPWLPLTTNLPAPNGIGTVQDAAATDRQRFYRVTAP
jgi:hypothetical protein